MDNFFIIDNGCVSWSHEETGFWGCNVIFGDDYFDPNSHTIFGGNQIEYGVKVHIAWFGLGCLDLTVYAGFGYLTFMGFVDVSRGKIRGRLYSFATLRFFLQGFTLGRVLRRQLPLVMLYWPSPLEWYYCWNMGVAMLNFYGSWIFR